MGDLTVPPAVFATLPINADFFFGNDGLLPQSEVDLVDFAGSINGNNRSFDPNLAFFDQSAAESDQFSLEARFTSSLDGPFNFLVAGYYLDFESSSEFAIASNSLDYFSAVGGVLTAAQLGLPPNFFDGQALATTFFLSETDLFRLQSVAGFGELYWQATDDLKATFGIRYTSDEKTINDRQPPLLTGGFVPIGDASVDAIAEIIPDFRDISETFSATTGRFVLDWTPELDFTDSTLVYFSYSRGFKSGGINPPVDPAISGIVGATFEPEFINAFEVGTKNVLLDNKLQASLTGFYYDYSGLQVARIVERTGFNENIDATIAGLEAEFLYAPTENWLFNATASYLHTSVGEATSVDAADLTGGRTDVTLIKDLTAAENCLIEHNGAPPPETVPALQLANGGFLIPSAVPTPGIAATGAFSAVGCGAGLNAVLAGLNATGLPYTQLDGEPIDIEGNELPNSPDWSFSIGAQYTHYFSQGLSLVGRADYYRQGESFGRIFNRPETDTIGEWGQLNFRVTLNGPDEKWFVAGWVQNALDDDNITGHALGGAGVGLGTSVFVLDPRLYGVNLGVRF